MKQLNRISCIKGVIAVLLLLLQTVSFAQPVQDSVSAPYYDTVVTVERAYEDEPSDVAATELYPDTVTFRQVPDSVVMQRKNSEEFAYANDPSFWKKEKSRRNNTESQGLQESWLDRLVAKTWFRRLMLAIMVSLLVFAVVKIALSNRLVLRRSPKQFAGAEDDALLQKENLDNLVLQAEQQGNFRLAVRYRYMKTLQQMDARGILQLDAKSTNWDYVNRLANHPLKKQFLLLTRAYEYVWYGEFSLSREQYGYLKTAFQNFENSLS